METAIVTTHPFGNNSDKPIKAIESIVDKVLYNPYKRKMTTEEHAEFLLQTKPNYIIAGTEAYNENNLSLCDNLKIISRVGIGIDAIDLDECKKRGIVVCNTPDAMSNAVAELVILQTLNMLRKVQNVSTGMIGRGEWNRYVGRELSGCLVGIIGFGRIGKLVYNKIGSLTDNKILINDIEPKALIETIQAVPSSLNDIYAKCDIITIHIPLRDQKVNNYHFIGKKELEMMKPDVRLLNLSRGGIINEEDLYAWLKENKKACAAIDTFEKEVYTGKLKSLGNAYLTPHLGSCTLQARDAMEMGAVNNLERYILNYDIKDRVV